MTKDGNFVGFQKGKKVANTLSEASVVESMVLSCPVCVRIARARVTLLCGAMPARQT